MKILLITLLVSSACAMSQDADFRRSFNRYEDEKNDKTTALLWSSLIPGGGLFYNGKIGAGIGMLTGTLVWGSMYKGLGEGDFTFWLSTLIVARIVDIIWSINSVDDYNADLRARLKISVSAIRGSPALGVSIAL
jgi:TM2 domain-containing membrane protein YozV